MVLNATQIFLTKWLIYIVGHRLGFRLQIWWLHCTVQKSLHIADTRTRIYILIPNCYCTHYEIRVHARQWKYAKRSILCGYRLNTCSREKAQEFQSPKSHFHCLAILIQLFVGLQSLKLLFIFVVIIFTFVKTDFDRFYIVMETSHSVQPLRLQAFWIKQTRPINTYILHCLLILPF